MTALASLLNGYAGGAQRQKDRKQRERELSIMEANTQPRGTERGIMPDAPATRRVSRGTHVPSANPNAAIDPVATDIPNAGRAFLNTIAPNESNGVYNVRYTPEGGANFDGYADHPRIYEDGPAGRSSAAGRYQFTAQTWDDMGGGDFSPENQDVRAWQLAQDRYRSYTGGDLLAELEGGGVNEGMLRALEPTWAGFGGNLDSSIAAYNDSMSRYAAPVPAPEPASTSRGILPQLWDNIRGR